MNPSHEIRPVVLGASESLVLLYEHLKTYQLKMRASFKTECGRFDPKKSVKDHGNIPLFFWEIFSPWLPFVELLGVLKEQPFVGPCDLSSEWSSGWWFQICFIFTHRLGKIPILTSICFKIQRGWNYQLVIVDLVESRMRMTCWWWPSLYSKDV